MKEIWVSIVYVFLLLAFGAFVIWMKYLDNKLQIESLKEDEKDD